jgi:molecular chaperone GrpE
MEEKNRDIEIGYLPDEEGAEDGTPVDDGLAQPKKTPEKHPHHAKKPASRLHELEEMLNRVISERDEFKDKYLRGMADIDNTRKRLKKEKEDFQKYVLSDFLLDMMQALDNLERALKVKASEAELPVLSGVEITLKQFYDVLRRYNVVEIDALGKVFDPNLHQALAKEERTTVAEPTVVEVYQKGFLYNDKLLRPALVKVAVPLVVADTAVEPRP